MKPQVTMCMVTQPVRMLAVKSAWRSLSLAGLAPGELAQMYRLTYRGGFDEFVNYTYVIMTIC